MKYIAPKNDLQAFNCPHCQAYAHQIWSDGQEIERGYPKNVEELKISKCSNCEKHSFWVDYKIVYPNLIEVPQPNSDLNAEIKNDYIEAAIILNNSPRGAVALLRLCIQKLCEQLGEWGDLNDMIKNLVKKGLSEKIQRSLDIVRVIGNNAVHPGQIDIKDDKETALKMFSLINIIAEVMITNPKEIDNLYNTLPETSKNAIKKRDS